MVWQGPRPGERQEGPLTLTLCVFWEPKIIQNGDRLTVKHFFVFLLYYYYLCVCSDQKTHFCGSKFQKNFYMEQLRSPQIPKAYFKLGITELLDLFVKG